MYFSCNFFWCAFCLAVLFVWLLSASFIPNEAKSQNHRIIGIVTSLIFFFCVCMHVFNCAFHKVYFIEYVFCYFTFLLPKRSKPQNSWIKYYSVSFFVIIWLFSLLPFLALFRVIIHQSSFKQIIVHFHIIISIWNTSVLWLAVKLPIILQTFCLLKRDILSVQINFFLMSNFSPNFQTWHLNFQGLSYFFLFESMNVQLRKGNYLLKIQV